MSDGGLADDLFGDSGAASPAPVSRARSSTAEQERRSPAPASEADKDEQPEQQTNGQDEAQQDDDIGDDLMKFGDDDEDEQAPQPMRSRVQSSPPTPGSPRSDASPNPLEYPEEEDAAYTVSETWSNIAVPTWDRLQPSNAKVWQLKLPQYVDIDSRPYDAELYSATLDPNEAVDGAADPVAAQRKMIGVKNTLRWRWVAGEDGEPARHVRMYVRSPLIKLQVRQSNSRFLRWSDGSVSLQIGQELYDVAPSTGRLFPKPAESQAAESSSQAQPKKDPAVAAAAGTTTFMCYTDMANEMLATESILAGQLSLLPTSMNSATHRELFKHVGEKHTKRSKMQLLEDVADKEKVSELMRKAAGDIVKVARPKAARAGGSGTGASGSGGASGGRAGGSRAGKPGGRGGRKSMRDYSSDEDEYDSDRRRSTMPKRRVERVDAGDYDEDDGFVVADDDDDESEARESDEDDDDAAYGSKRKSGSSGKKGSKSKSSSSARRKNRDRDDEDEDAEEEDGEGEDDVLDEMEEAERRIEADERKRKRAKREKDGKDSKDKEREREKKRKSREYVSSDEEDAAAATAAGGEQDAEGEEDMDMEIESEGD